MVCLPARTRFPQNSPVRNDGRTRLAHRSSEGRVVWPADEAAGVARPSAPGSARADLASRPARHRVRACPRCRRTDATARVLRTSAARDASRGRDVLTAGRGEWRLPRRRPAGGPSRHGRERRGEHPWRTGGRDGAGGPAGLFRPGRLGAAGRAGRADRRQLRPGVGPGTNGGGDDAVGRGSAAFTRRSGRPSPQSASEATPAKQRSVIERANRDAFGVALRHGGHRRPVCDGCLHRHRDGPRSLARRAPGRLPAGGAARLPGRSRTRGPPDRDRLLAQETGHVFRAAGCVPRELGLAQPAGLMATAGVPAVSINSRYLAAVRLSPAVAAEPAALRVSPRRAGRAWRRRPAGTSSRRVRARSCRSAASTSPRPAPRPWTRPTRRRGNGSERIRFVTSPVLEATESWSVR